MTDINSSGLPLDQTLLERMDDEWSRRFGGSLIDDDGNEIPITSTMIQDACTALEQHAITGLHARAPDR